MGARPARVGSNVLVAQRLFAVRFLQMRPRQAHKFVSALSAYKPAQRGVAVLLGLCRPRVGVRMHLPSDTELSSQSAEEVSMSQQAATSQKEGPLAHVLP